MKTVILVYAKISFEENYPYSWIPYSVLSLASAVPKDEYNCIIFDGNRKNEDEFKKLLLEPNILAVGFSIMTGGKQIEYALRLAKYVKDYDEKITTVFGGPHVNVLPEQTLAHPLVDMVIVGPGQESFYQVLQYIESKKMPDKIGGFMYKHNNQTYKTIPTIPLKSLYPYDFSQIDIADYLQYDSTISNRTINYIASQGCVYACNFCYECTYKRKYYKMPLKYVERDIEYFVNTYDVTGIKFYDADFFIDRKAALSISSILKRYDLRWAASIHPKDILLSEAGEENKLLKELRDSNCTRLLMGVESGCNRVLKQIINKRVTKEEILFVAKRIAQYGLLGSYTFMVGLPGEQDDEIDETFEFVKRLSALTPKPEVNIHIYIPYPGTPLYNAALEMGFQPPEKLEDWSGFNYYKAMTPWTTKQLEDRVNRCKYLINKKEKLN